MNIEIRKPNLEALIQQGMASGRFTDAEDMILYALQCVPPGGGQDLPSGEGNRPNSGLGRNLVQVLAGAQSFAGDLKLSRDPSPGRSADLS